jgi:hypothetical protein
MLIIFAVEIKPFLVVVLFKIPEKADGRRAEHDAKLTFCEKPKRSQMELGQIAEFPNLFKLQFIGKGVPIKLAIDVNGNC